MKFDIFVDHKTRERIDGNKLFSEVYDSILKPLIEEDFLNIKQLVKGKFDAKTLVEYGVGYHAIGGIGAKDLFDLLEKQLDQIVWETPPHLFQEFYGKIRIAFRQFCSDHASEMNAFNKNIKSAPEETGLTIEVNSLTKENVQPVLPKLIQRLNRATETRGSKSELAKWLGVHRQSVTDWLSGKQEPGGEITLKMLHWVEQRERQK